MATSSELDHAVALAESSMRLHPQHDLLLGHRQQIWAALGPRLQPGGIRDNCVGYRRRFRMAVLTARKVLPIWSNMYPEDDTPTQVLSIAENVNLGKMTDQDGWIAWQKCFCYFDRIAEKEQEGESTAGVGYSTAQTLKVALQDESFDGNSINPELKDTDIDPDDMDTSFFAAAAYSNGPIWDEESDSSKRKEFWEWWIEQVVAYVEKLAD